MNEALRIFWLYNLLLSVVHLKIAATKNILFSYLGFDFTYFIFLVLDSGLL